MYSLMGTFCQRFLDSLDLKVSDVTIHKMFLLSYMEIYTVRTQKNRFNEAVGLYARYIISGPVILRASLILWDFNHNVVYERNT